MLKKRTWILAVVILGLFVSLPLLAEARKATPLDTWTNRNNFSTTIALNSATDNGAGTAFVAVGNTGMALRSTDGNFWTVAGSGTTRNLLGVTYGAGPARFVAVGETKTILYSPDGAAWYAATTTGIVGNLRAVTYGGGYYVAVGDAGKIYNSTDGINWTQQGASKTTVALYAVTYANGRFVAVGAGGVVMVSKDSILWVRNMVISGGGTLQAVTYGKPTFGDVPIWVVANSAGRIWTSPDATMWTPYTAAQSGITVAIKGLTFAGGVFVAVGNSGKIYTSDDGEWWQIATVPLSPATLNPITTNLRAVGTNGTDFYAVGDAGTILSSTSKYDWPYKSANLGALTANTYGSGMFVVAGQYGNMFTSTTGTTWSESRLTTSWLNAPYIEAVTYGSGLFVAVGDQDEDSTVPVIFTSPDGATWTQVSPDQAPFAITAQDLMGVTFGAGLYVAVGTGGTIITSPDATTWTLQASGTSYTLNSVTYGGGYYVAVGNRTVLWSTNGINWNNIAVTTPPNFEAVTYASVGGTGVYIAVASNGTIYRSTAPNLAWERAAAVGVALYGVTYGSTTYGFLAVGAGAYATYSPSGSTWTAITTRAGTALYGVSYGNSTYVGSGTSSKIFQSPTAP